MKKLGDARREDSLMEFCIPKNQKEFSYLPLCIFTGILLEPGSEAPLCWWATVKTIAGNDCNLAAGRYKPMVTEAAPDDDPAELIQEVLDIEKDITKGLAKLLMEIKK